MLKLCIDYGGRVEFRGNAKYTRAKMV